MFEIQPIDAITYRQQTRRSTLIIALLFLVLAVNLLVYGRLIRRWRLRRAARIPF